MDYGKTASANRNLLDYLRSGGRVPLEQRNVIITPHEQIGHFSLSLGDTKVLVCAHWVIEPPSEKSEDGQHDIYVEVEDVPNTTLSRRLERFLAETQLLSSESLVINRGKLIWRVTSEFRVIVNDGNVEDAVSMAAVISALSTDFSEENPAVNSSLLERPIPVAKLGKHDYSRRAQFAVHRGAADYLRSLSSAHSSAGGSLPIRLTFAISSGSSPASQLDKPVVIDDLEEIVKQYQVQYEENKESSMVFADSECDTSSSNSDSYSDSTCFAITFNERGESKCQTVLSMKNSDIILRTYILRLTKVAGKAKNITFQVAFNRNIKSQALDINIWILTSSEIKEDEVKEIYKRLRISPIIYEWFRKCNNILESTSAGEESNYQRVFDHSVFSVKDTELPKSIKFEELLVTPASLNPKDIYEYSDDHQYILFETITSNSMKNSFTVEGLIKNRRNAICEIEPKKVSFLRDLIKTDVNISTEYSILSDICSDSSTEDDNTNLNELELKKVNYSSQSRIKKPSNSVSPVCVKLDYRYKELIDSFEIVESHDFLGCLQSGYNLDVCPSAFCSSDENSKEELSPSKTNRTNYNMCPKFASGSDSEDNCNDIEPSKLSSHRSAVKGIPLFLYDPSKLEENSSDGYLTYSVHPDGTFSQVDLLMPSGCPVKMYQLFEMLSPFAVTESNRIRSLLVAGAQNIIRYRMQLKQKRNVDLSS